MNLDERIESLSDQVDPTIRTELQAHLRSLRRDANSVGTLLGMSRLALLLVRKVFVAVGEKAPNDNLYDCLVRLSTGDPALKIPGLKLLPKEVDTRTHAVRILSNMVDHAVEAAPPTVNDAEDALSLFLRLLRWYYVEFDRGPRLRSIERPSPRSRTRQIALSVCAVGAILLVAVSLGIWYSLPQRTDAGAPSSTSTDGLGNLLVAGVPPTGQGPNARLALDLLKWDVAMQRFVQLSDGASLRSEKDQYAIVARPGTAGYLYVFQIDSRGYVNWYFPENSDPDSHGTNPVAAGLPVCVPTAESKHGLTLDNHVGKERIVAVLTASAWPALEQSLATALRQQSPVEVAADLRSAKGSTPLATTTDVEVLHTKVRLVSQELEATGTFLQVVRWFQHE